MGFLYILTYLLHNALFFLKKTFYMSYFFLGRSRKCLSVLELKRRDFWKTANQKAWFENLCYSEAKKEMGIANTEEDFV